MAKNNNLTDFLTDLANGIRNAETGSETGDAINPQDFRERVEAIPSNTLTKNAVTRANTTATTTANDTNDTLTITASNNQGTGYVTGSNKTASKVVTLSVAIPTIDADGNVTAIAAAQDNSSTPVKVSKTSSALALGKKTSSDLTVNGATVSVPAGYYPAAASKTIDDATFGPIGWSKDADDNTYTIFLNPAGGGYIKDERIQIGTLTVPFATQTISYSINSSTGVVAGTINNTTEGYVYGPGVTVPYSLPTVSAVQIIPGTSDKTAVAAGKYTTGAVTVAGSPTLVSSNIKSGVTIFGVQGTYTGNTYENAETEEW